MNYRRVIVPLDGSELAETVLPHLEALASNCQITTIELVRAVPHLEMHYKAAVPLDARQERQMDEADKKAAEEYLQKIKKRLDSSRMTVTTTVLFGRPAETLAEYIEKSDADLLVIATHGRSGPSRWVWGSVTDKLLHCVCIPVFVVRPPECRPKA